MEPSRLEHSSNGEKVISPFANREVAISQKKGSSGKMIVIITIGLFCAAAAVAAFFIMHYAKDPYCTLETFPVGKYFDTYQGLAGSKFKAEFRVEADLGWKDSAGRLMLLSAENDPRPIAVFIPQSISSGIYFTKGQTYAAAIEVKEGGLIYADSCQKN